jgi:hypothetical protein
VACGLRLMDAMYLHIFVADCELTASKGLTKQCAGLRLSVVNEDDRHEYNIFTESEKEDFRYRFQQTIPIPIDHVQFPRTKQQQEALLTQGRFSTANYLIRLRFTLFAIYRDSGPSNKEQAVCLGFGKLTTSLHEETASKTVVLQEYHDTDQRLYAVETNGNDFHIAGKLFLTLFYHSSPIELGDSPHVTLDNRPSDRRTFHPVNEYSFLLSRKLRSKDGNGNVTFDPLLESRLINDLQCYRDNTYFPSDSARKTNNHSVPIPHKAKKIVSDKASKKTAPSITAFSADSFTYNRRAVTPTRVVAKKVPPTLSEPPKLRKTHMAVGFVKSEWPEQRQYDSERRLYQLQLVTDKKRQLLEQIKQQVHNNNLSRKQGTRQHTFQQIHNEKQKQVQQEKNRREQGLLLQLQRQETDVKKLELQLTKLRLEHALSHSQDTSEKVKQTTPATARDRRRSLPPSQVRRSNSSTQRRSSTTVKTSEPTHLLQRLLQDVEIQQKDSSKKATKQSKLLANDFINEKKTSKLHNSNDTDISKEMNNWDRLMLSTSSSPVRTRVKEREQRHSRATTSPSTTIAAVQPVPSFVKTSIVESLRSMDREGREAKSRSKSAQIAKSKINRLASNPSEIEAVSFSHTDDRSANNVIRVSVQKLKKQKNSILEHKDASQKIVADQALSNETNKAITRYLDSDPGEFSDDMDDEQYFSRGSPTYNALDYYRCYPQDDNFAFDNTMHENVQEKPSSQRFTPNMVSHKDHVNMASIRSNTLPVYADEHPMTYPSNDDSDGDSDVTSVADSEVHLKNDFCDDESDGNIIADFETHSENDLCDGENDGNIVADSETHSENDLCDGNSDPDSEAHSENESSHNPTLMDEIALPTTHVWKQDWNRENETVSQSDYDSNGWSITGPPPTDNLDMNELKINSQPVQQQTQLLVALSQTDVNEVTSINAGVDDELSVHFPPFLNSLVAAQGPISSTVDIEDNYENEIGIADSSDISVVEAITVDKGNFVVNPANNDERTSPFFVPVADDSYSDNDDEVLRHTIMKKQLYFTTLDKSLSSSAGDFDVQFPALQDQKLKTRSDDTVAVLKTKEETTSSSVDNNKTCATTVNVNDVDEDKNSAQGLAERELFHKIMREESDEDTVRALRTPVHGVREVKPFGNATSVDENEEERDYFPKYDSGGCRVD